MTSAAQVILVNQVNLVILVNLMILMNLVILADGDTKSILTDNADRAIQGNVAMHVTHPVNLVVKF